MQLVLFVALGFRRKGPRYINIKSRVSYNIADYVLLSVEHYSSIVQFIAALTANLTILFSLQFGEFLIPYA